MDHYIQQRLMQIKLHLNTEMERLQNIQYMQSEEPVMDISYISKHQMEGKAVTVIRLVAAE